MTRSRVQLIVAHTLDHDLVEADARDAQPRHGRANGDPSAGERNAIGRSLTRRGDRIVRLLRLPLLPDEIRPICAFGVPQAGMAYQHRSRDAQAYAGEPGGAISRHEGQVPPLAAGVAAG